MCLFIQMDTCVQCVNYIQFKVNYYIVLAVYTVCMYMKIQKIFSFDSALKFLTLLISTDGRTGG